MPHEKGQGSASSFDCNLNHSWRGSVKLATFTLEPVTSQLRGFAGFALVTGNLWMPTALSVLVVLAGYYAGAIVGISLGFPPAGIAAIWPSTAILLAALLLAPPRYWWLYLLGVVPAHVHVVTSFQRPAVPFLVMLIQVGTNILLAVLAALAVRFATGAPPRFGSLRNMGAFILLAGVLTTALVCVVAVCLFLLTGWTTDFWLAWRQRMFANVFATVTIPPVIVLAFAGQLVGAQQASWRSHLELALITMGVLVVGIPVFSLEAPGLANVPALLLAPLPFLMWAAVRLGVGCTGITLLIVAGIALANAYVGRGPFISQAPDVNVFSLQIFLTSISIPLLLLAALVEERWRTEVSLKQTSKRTELALADRDTHLALVGKAALVGSYAYDVDTDLMQVDEGYAALHGLPEGTVEMTRSERRARTHPDDVAKAEEARQQAFRERLGECGQEYRIVRSDGAVRWIESRSFITYTGDGRPQRVTGVNIDITDRKRAEERLRLLVAELDHRVKNALATVSAITSHTQEASGSGADFVAALNGRIKSMAATHQLLSQRQWKGILLSDLVHRELAPYAANGNTEVGGHEVMLNADAAQTVSMVLHELATNAAKHGALSTPNGRVSVRWDRVVDGEADAPLRMDWQERGGPAVHAPDRSGYGMEVIRDLLPYELDGKVELAFHSEGVRCRLDIPVSSLAGDQPTGRLNAAGLARASKRG